MADITMCEGDGCPRKESCYRFTAPMNEFRQSFFMTVPLVDGMHCTWFIKNTLDGCDKDVDTLIKTDLP